jgi:hypothetical protein
MRPGGRADHGDKEVCEPTLPLIPRPVRTMGASASRTPLTSGEQAQRAPLRPRLLALERD